MINTFVFGFLGVVLLSGQAGFRPGGRGTFLCFAKEKYPKEGRPLLSVSRRCAPGNLWCSHRAGSAQTRFAQTCAALFPPGAALLGTDRRGLWRAAPFQATEELPLCWVRCATPPEKTPCARAEQRRRMRKKKAACLSRRRVCGLPAFGEQRRLPGATRRDTGSGGRLSFGYFSLAKQRKVPRPPGRNPACPESKTTLKKQTRS